VTDGAGGAGRENIGTVPGGTGAARCARPAHYARGMAFSEAVNTPRRSPPRDRDHGAATAGTPGVAHTPRAQVRTPLHPSVLPAHFISAGVRRN
jgi:hypothetical protein